MIAVEDSRCARHAPSSSAPGLQLAVTIRKKRPSARRSSARPRRRRYRPAFFALPILEDVAQPGLVAGPPSAPRRGRSPRSGPERIRGVVRREDVDVAAPAAGRHPPPDSSEFGESDSSSPARPERGARRERRGARRFLLPKNMAVRPASAPHGRRPRRMTRASTPSSGLGGLVPAVRRGPAALSRRDCLRCRAAQDKVIVITGASMRIGGRTGDDLSRARRGIVLAARSAAEPLARSSVASASARSRSPRASSAARGQREAGRARARAFGPAVRLRRPAQAGISAYPRSSPTTTSTTPIATAGKSVLYAVQAVCPLFRAARAARSSRSRRCSGTSVRAHPQRLQRGQGHGELADDQRAPRAAAAVPEITRLPCCPAWSPPFGSSSRPPRRPRLAAAPRRAAGHGGVRRDHRRRHRGSPAPRCSRGPRCTRFRPSSTPPRTSATIEAGLGGPPAVSLRPRKKSARCGDCRSPPAASAAGSPHPARRSRIIACLFVATCR